MLIRKEKMLMRNGKKSLKKASVLLTTFLLVVMCLAVDTTSVSAAKIKLNKTKLTLTQGKKYRLKIKGTKKESEMVLHKEISGNC